MFDQDGWEKRRNEVKRVNTRVAFLLMIILGLMTLLPITSLAEEMSISVQAVLPENQVTKNAGYYDLRVTPEQEQTLELKLYNRGEKDATVNLVINPAYTSEGGAFIYSQGVSKKDESLKFPLTDIATTPEAVSIPAKGEVITEIKLKVPKEPFKGVILGGIHVTSAKEEEADTSQSGKNGFNISNNMAYSIALRLSEEETLPKSDLLLKSVSATQVTGRNTVKVNLQNPTPTIIDKVSYDASITKKGSNEVLHQNKVSDYRIAPNTNYNFPISWDNKPFEAGTYTVQMVVKSEETKQEWKLKQDFTISAKEAKELNEKAVDLEENNLNWFIYGGIALGSLLVILIVLVIVLAKKKKVRRKKAQKNRKKAPGNLSTKKRIANTERKDSGKKHDARKDASSRKRK